MNKVKGFLLKVVYATGANLLGLVVSFLITLLIPVFLGEEVAQYGYFQIYWFYVSYIGFFHLGLFDGILLRHGGKKYSQLNKSECSFQFWFITIAEFIISLGIISVVQVTVKENNYRFIYCMLAADIAVYMSGTILQYYLQTVNRIKEYASITIISKAAFGIILILIFLIGKRNYKLFILGDWISKLLAMFAAIYWCREIVCTKPCNFQEGFYEVKNNISVGIKLMFANVAGMLITGIVRWGIQNQWDVETYGKISFTLSISNLFLVFLGAIAVVLYPTLKRIDSGKLPQIYDSIRDSLMIILLGSLVFYYPIFIILSKWLPQYTEGLRYMAILFPLCIYATKMTMLIQTYMQVFRLEKFILRVNLLGVAIAVLTTIFSVFIMHNLTFAMFSIVFNQMIRCIYAELRLGKIVKIEVKKDILCETILTIGFVLGNWYLGGARGTVLYLLIYTFYLLLKKKAIKKLLSSVQKITFV